MFREWAQLLDREKGASNIAEVLVLALLIYGLLAFLRGGRGENMLKTLGILLAVGFIIVREVAKTELLQWERLVLVLDTIFQASIIALVVIFQPELRRGLALRIGQKWFTAPIQVQQVAEEIADTATRLSKTKVGALMVLERQDGLDDYIASGQPVDAPVKDELLRTIFFPGTPMHDGAVIIQGGRIAAAGCILPLTEQTNIGQQLGTRHRAGLGLSEVSDALIVIVSEETGIISIAEGGRLHRNLDRDKLMALLHELYLSPAGERPAPAPVVTPDGAAISGPPQKITTRVTRKVVAQ